VTPGRRARRSTPLLVAATALAAAVLGACAAEQAAGPGVAPTDATAPSPVPVSTTTTAAGRTTASAPATASTGEESGGARGDGACGTASVSSDGRVVRAELTEASGLAASRRHPDVLWAHNDSGSAAGVFAVDLAGRDLGFFALVDGGRPADVVDPEDLAIVDGTLYLADIGDNGRQRDLVQIHVFDEPAPGSDGTVEATRVVRVRYPDGPTDAEALLVDPVGGELVLLSKDSEDKSAPTRLYTVDPEAADAAGGDASVVEATLAGTVDVAALTARSTAGGFNPAALLFPGAVTGADVSPEGDLVAVRTYGSVWLFRRAPGQSLADALQGPACEGGAAAEGQGEAVAVLPSPGGAGETAVRYATVGEGQAPPVNLVRVEVGG